MSDVLAAYYDPLKKRFALALELAPVKYQHLSLLTLKEVF
jgi:hypothetical protein